MPTDPASFIAGLIQEDIGVAAGRTMLREAGMSMSNEAFSSLYGQVRDALGGREGLQGLDYEAIPTGEQYSTWAAGRGDQYATYVTSYVRPEGSREVEERFYFHLTDEPHTPAEAVEAAQGFLAGDAEAEARYGPATIVGSVVTSVNRTVGRASIL